MSQRQQAMLKFKPIRSEDDLELAKGRLNDMLLTTSNDDDVEILSLLIEDFEKTLIRILPPTPIAAIKFRMNELGLSPRHLEPFIGTRARVSEVLGGKRTLSIDMIRSLHDGLSIPYESLLSARISSEEYDASTEAVASINLLGFDLEKFDVASFVRSTVPDSMPSVLHRRTRTQRAVLKTNQHALQLWQAVAIKRSEQRDYTRFSNKRFAAPDLRQLALLSTKSNSPQRAVDFLADRGIALVSVPQLPGTFLDGAAMLNPQGTPVIALTLRHDRVDGFWFTLLHECAHIALHLDELGKTRAIFVDDLEIQSDDDFEKQADNLARDSLIPPEILSQVRWDSATDQDEIISLSSRARVHISIAAGRWQRDHQNYKRFSRLIERCTVKQCLR